MRLGDPLSSEDIADLADAFCRESGVGDGVQNGSGRFVGKIVPIGCADEFSIRIDKWTCDHPADSKSIGVPARDLADLVQSV